MGVYNLEVKVYDKTFCARGSGDLSTEFLLELIDKLMEVEKSHPEPLNRFMDISRMTGISIDYKRLSPFAEMRRRAIKLYGDVKIKVAIYATTPVSFGMARMYETLMTMDSVEVRVFRDFNQAAEWLGVSTDILAYPE